MQAKQRALEHNKLDVRFEDYLIQLFSCQSDKGEALNQVTTRREKQNSAFSKSSGCRAFNTTCLNQFISIKTQFQFQDIGEFHLTTYTAPLSVARRHPHPVNSLPPKRRHDVTLLLQTSFLSG